MPTEITLIGLGGYPDWSENSWGAHATLLILPCHGSYIRRYVATYKHNKMYVIVHSSLLFYSEFSKFNAYTRLVSWFQICDYYGILELRNVIQLVFKFSWLSWIKNDNVFKKIQCHWTGRDINFGMSNFINFINLFYFVIWSFCLPLTIADAAIRKGTS